MTHQFQTGPEIHPKHPPSASTARPIHSEGAAATLGQTWAVAHSCDIGVGNIYNLFGYISHAAIILTLLNSALPAALAVSHVFSRRLNYAAEYHCDIGYKLFVFRTYRETCAARSLRCLVVYGSSERIIPAHPRGAFRSHSSSLRGFQINAVTLHELSPDRAKPHRRAATGASWTSGDGRCNGGLYRGSDVIGARPSTALSDTERSPSEQIDPQGVSDPTAKGTT